LGLPPLGEHTDAILRELGYESSQIQALREAGTI
jgi:crotonobetainyl-CoA:carnitine CoA-transferase CaiB-like acyl-CoA transferase